MFHRFLVTLGVAALVAGTGAVGFASAPDSKPESQTGNAAETPKATGEGSSAGAAHDAAETAGKTAHPAADWTFLEQYCSECHNATDWAGGVAFDTMTPDSIGEEAKAFEEAVRRLRGRLMPPPGKPQPPQKTVDEFVGWMEGRLDAEGSKHNNPGEVALHRLNRTEYGQAIEGMLGLRVDVASLLPRDTESDGFDNVANVLKVSPSFLDQYISAASEVSMQAVGKAQPALEVKSYRASPDAQRFHIDGMPLGTRGGMLVEHWFPADGEYEFSLAALGGAGYIGGLDHRHDVIMTIDGKTVFTSYIGGPEDQRIADQKQAEGAKMLRDRFQKIRVPVKAGPRKVAVTFLAKTFAESDDTLEPFTPGGGMDRLPVVGGIEVKGPFNPTSVGNTPSRQKIFTCRPESAAQETPCAKQIVSQLARQAYRRPVTEADLAAPMRFYAAGRSTGDFDAGIQQALMAILSSPKFLYRAEAPPADAQPGAPYQITDLQLASRLSFFLWSQGPDEQLLEIAAAGKLRDAGVLDAQVQRMLKDPRSKTLVTNFAYQWLGVGKVEMASPDSSRFPEFDEGLRAAFREEIQMFVDSVLRSDQSVVSLLTSDQTFLNERLALHYGVPNIRGDQFRRVTLKDPNRFGLLGKGSVLTGTSYADRTAPVLRGAWILENITGTPPAAPPPGVETLKQEALGDKPLTMRERMALHSTNPSCFSCHGVMDPLGFALENFDAVGKWRDRDRDALTTIDASGKLPDGTSLNGPADLRKALASRPEQFALAFTEKLMIFALGRGIEYHDMPTVRAIVRSAGQQDYRFSAIVSGIVKSAPFQMKQAPATGNLSADTKASSPH